MVFIWVELIDEMSNLTIGISLFLRCLSGVIRNVIEEFLHDL